MLCCFLKVITFWWRRTRRQMSEKQLVLTLAVRYFRSAAHDQQSNSFSLYPSLLFKAMITTLCKPSVWSLSSSSQLLFSFSLYWATHSCENNVHFSLHRPHFSCLHTSYYTIPFDPLVCVNSYSHTQFEIYCFPVNKKQLSLLIPCGSSNLYLPLLPFCGKLGIINYVAIFYL